MIVALVHLWNIAAELRQFDRKISVIGDFEKRLVKNFDLLNSGVQNRLATIDQEIRANANSINQIKLDVGVVRDELQNLPAKLSTYNQGKNGQDGLATTNPTSPHATTNAADRKNLKSHETINPKKPVFQRIEKTDGKVEYRRVK